MFFTSIITCWFSGKHAGSLFGDPFVISTEEVKGKQQDWEEMSYDIVSTKDSANPVYVRGVEWGVWR